MSGRAGVENVVVGSQLARRVSRIQQGGVRAAVLGVNDGLVSTLCLIVGVAAAGAGQSAVILAGVAGLLAGAISMAAGEWISVKAQVELFEGIITDLKREMKRDKQVLIHSLAHTLASHGLPLKSAEQVSHDIAKNNEHFLSIYSMQVIGLNPQELGSPWKVAFSSFVLFAIGSSIPLVPWLFIGDLAAIGVSITLTSLAGLFVGGFVAYSSGKSLTYGALRQLLIIIASSVVTYGIGYLFGVVVG